MRWDAAMLLAGPRGRRLCLELAVRHSEDVATGLRLLAFDMDGHRDGRRGTAMFFGARPALAEVPAAPTILEFARCVAQVDPAAVTARDVWDALARSVDMAMYWQEPYPEDVVAGTPPVTAALTALADAVIAQTPGWWTAACRPDQWEVHWTDREGDQESSLPAAEALARWDAGAHLGEQRARCEGHTDPTAPYSGTWWATPDGVRVTTGVTDQGAPAGLRLVEDSLGDTEATSVSVRGGGRVCEIRCAEDWAGLCRCFPLEVTASRRHDWYRTTGRAGRWLIPDWRRVADVWDGVHVTVAGYLQAATRSIPVDAERAAVLAGWGPDATVWLTDVSSERDGIRQSWVWDGDADVWTPAPR